jgi:hypothetical protein
MVTPTIPAIITIIQLVPSIIAIFLRHLAFPFNLRDLGAFRQTILKHAVLEFCGHFHWIDFHRE